MLKTTYDNTNSGLLFKQDIRDNPRRPPLKGFLDVEGVEYNVSIWPMRNSDGSARVSKEGEQMYKIIVEPKDGQERVPT